MEALLEKETYLPDLQKVDFDTLIISTSTNKSGFFEFNLVVNGINKTVGYTKKDVYEMILNSF